MNNIKKEKKTKSGDFDLKLSGETPHHQNVDPAKNADPVPDLYITKRDITKSDFPLQNVDLDQSQSSTPREGSDRDKPDQNNYEVTKPKGTVKTTQYYLDSKKKKK